MSDKTYDKPSNEALQDVIKFEEKFIQHEMQSIAETKISIQGNVAKLESENKALADYLEQKYESQDVKSTLKRLNFIITSWAGLVEISPITDIREIVSDKEAMHLMSAQFDKYQIIGDSSAGDLYDKSIKQLQELTEQIKKTVGQFKSAAAAFKKALDEADKEASGGDKAKQN